MSYQQSEKAIYIRGDQTDVDCPASLAPLNAGDVVAFGVCVGIALEPINANNDPPGRLIVSGVFRFQKEVTSGAAVTLGEEIEWDATNKLAFPAGAGGGYTDSLSIGKAAKAQLSTDTTVDVLLNPYASSAAGV